MGQQLSRVMVICAWVEVHQDYVQSEGPMEGVATQAEADLAAQRAREVIHVKCHRTYYSLTER